MVAKNVKMPVKGSTAIRLQLQKLTYEIIVKFLVTKIDVKPCLLGMVFSYIFDCILKSRKFELIFAIIGKNSQFFLPQQSIKISFQLQQRINNYLVARKFS